MSVSRAGCLQAVGNQCEFVSNEREQKAHCVGNESELENALFASRGDYVCKLLHVGFRSDDCHTPKPEPDEDYHMVLRDTRGRTMIVESPHPTCATGSRFAQAIAAVRAKIDTHFGGPLLQKMRPQHLRVAVTGVGFFDRKHGQEGVATNGIELHPILDIVFHP